MFCKSYSANLVFSLTWTWCTWTWTSQPYTLACKTNGSHQQSGLAALMWNKGRGPFLPFPHHLPDSLLQHCTGGELLIPTSASNPSPSIDMWSVTGAFYNDDIIARFAFLKTRVDLHSPDHDGEEDKHGYNPPVHLLSFWARAWGWTTPNAS